MINLFQVTNGELEECEEQKLAVYEKLKVDFFSSEIQNKLWIENTHNRTIQQGPLWMLVNETIFTPSLERFEIKLTSSSSSSPSSPSSSLSSSSSS